MEKVRPWLPVIISVLVLAVVGYGVFRVFDLIHSTVDAGLGPVRQLSNSVGTEVANALHPTPTIIPDPVTIVHEVRSLARLETIQYSVEKVITAESGQGAFSFLVGDKILFVAHGTVVAGVDLQKLQPEDMKIVDGVLHVHLPKAEIFLATLDNDQSYVYLRQQAIFSQSNISLETAARQAAQDKIEQAALDDGILAQAQTNAENFLYRFFLQLGFPEVIFD